MTRKQKKTLWRIIFSFVLLAAAALLPLKIPASLFNAAVAIAAAPPLCLALRYALRRAHVKLA